VRALERVLLRLGGAAVSVGFEGELGESGGVVGIKTFLCEVTALLKGES
jgi:hypothetical protein